MAPARTMRSEDEAAAQQIEARGFSASEQDDERRGRVMDIHGSGSVR
jgi:hypothetical protein